MDNFALGFVLLLIGLFGTSMILFPLPDNKE